jgi:subtilisin family serine protease
MDGTSMATPHVAGLAALLFEAKKGATIDEVEQAIFASCTLGPGMSPDRGNRGIPDAVKALKQLTGVGPSAVTRGAPAPAKAPAKTPVAKAAKKAAAKATSIKSGKKGSRGRPAR